MVRSIAVLTALLILGASASAAQAAVPLPESDPFYTPPAGYELAAPGENFRSRSVDLKGPLSVPFPVSAKQTLFRTTDSQNRPVTAVATY